jgi:hypothetical protein
VRVIVAEVAAQTTTQVSLVQDDHVVEQLTADRPDHALGEGVLPWRAWRSEDLGDADALHPSSKLAPIGIVAIAEEEARRRVMWESLDDLLRRPSGSRGLGHVEVHDSAAAMNQDHEDEEHTESNGGHDEEVDRGEIGEVILEEGSPRLRREFRAPRHEPTDSAL